MQNWNIKRTVYTVSDFLSWMKSGELELSPSFQRRPVWPKKAKSYFVDTIFRGLPVPVVFLRERTDISSLKTIREVVDGQQRLRTIISYIAPQTLKDFDADKDDFDVLRTHNEFLAGVKFEDLNSESKESMLHYQFSVDVLPTETDDADVLKIFARMNSTGTTLNDQELRNAEYFGVFKDIAYSSAFEQLDRWRSWGIFNEQQIARMAEVELTSELFIYLMSGVQSKTQSAINRVYETYDDEFPMRNEVQKNFQSILELIEEILGKDIRNTVFRRPTIFYALFASLHAEFGMGKKLRSTATLRKSRQRLIEASERISEKSAPDSVIEATQRRLGHKSSRDAIVRYLLESV